MHQNPPQLTKYTTANPMKTRPTLELLLSAVLLVSASAREGVAQSLSSTSRVAEDNNPTQRIYVPQVFASKRTPMNAAQVREWVERRRVSVTTAPMFSGPQRVANRYQFETVGEGALFVDIPSTTSAVSFIYWTKQDDLYATFDLGVNQPLELVRGGFEQVGKDRWLRGGLRASGRPTAPMLELLTMVATAATRASRDARRTDGDKMTQEQYLELRSRMSSVKMELEFELEEAAKLQNEKERVDAKVTLLADLRTALGETEYNKAAAPLIAQQSLLASEVADVTSQKQPAEKARELVVAELGELARMNFVWQR